MYGKRSQVAMEFLILVAFVFVIGFIFIFVIGIQINDFSKEEKIDLIKGFGESLKNEISQASVVNEGYQRIIILPEEIEGSINYSIETQSSTLIIKTDLYDYTAVIPDVIGELKKGLNIIKNKKGFVLILNSYYDNNRVGHWKLNEGTGLTANDEQGNSDGIIEDAIWTSGVFKGALDFNGIDSYIEIPHDDVYFISDGTVSMWFKADVINNDHALFSKDSTGFDTGGHLTFWVESDGEFVVRIQSATDSYFINSPNAVNANEWYFAAISFGGNGLTFYLNGKHMNQSSYTGGLDFSSGGGGNFEPIAIGVSSRNSDDLVITPFRDPFDGVIDDIQFFNKQLSIAEINDVYLE